MSRDMALLAVAAIAGFGLGWIANQVWFDLKFVTVEWLRGRDDE